MSPGFSALRAFARARTASSAEHRCDLCGAPIAVSHEHLLSKKTGVPAILQCGCDACVRVLSTSAEVAQWARVPRCAEALTDFALTPEEWESLRLPIDLAFFQRSESLGRTRAIFPSPAGPTESSLPLDAWDRIVARSERVKHLAPDIEALLIHRLSGARDAFIVSIDECYRLVGIVRTYWRGIQGGPEVTVHLAQFFADLRARAGASSCPA